MPKKAKELSAAEVRRLSDPGTHPVGGVAGLLLQVTPTGARSWVLRFSTGAMLASSTGRQYAKRRELGLGGFPDVSLARARERAREAREFIRQGVDPVEERKAARERLRAAAEAFTFEQAARAYQRVKEHEWRNPKHRQQWENTLGTYAYPTLGRKPVADVELRDVLDVLEPIWTIKTETAKRLRGRIESVLAWATVSGHREGDNPARWRGNLDTVLAKPSKVAKVAHMRALPWQEVGAFMADLRKREGMGARALEFAIITAARSGEVRKATWSEIDLKDRVWTIPADRMKAGKEHRVPLADDAVALLEALPRFDGCPYVFPSNRGGPLSDMSLTAVLRRMGTDAVPHGFRSTFRDWAAESTNYPRDLCEQALAHAIGSDVEAAYRRGDMLVKRHKMMADWAKFLGTLPRAAEVRGIREATA